MYLSWVMEMRLRLTVARNPLLVKLTEFAFCLVIFSVNNYDVDFQSYNWSEIFFHACWKEQTVEIFCNRQCFARKNGPRQANLCLRAFRHDKF